jgi:SAM-dependent methyltransferase
VTGVSTSTDAFYESRAQEYFSRTATLSMAPAYAEFLPKLPAGAKILDLGCGSGRDLLAFKSQGFSPVGLDSSAALVELARQHSGAPCVHRRFSEISSDLGTFEGVWACASLLHVKKSQLPNVLLNIWGVLATGGVFFLSVKEGDGERTGSDGRYFGLYRNSEILRFLQESQFSVEKAWASESTLQGETTRWLNVIAVKPKQSRTLS